MKVVLQPHQWLKKNMRYTFEDQEEDRKSKKLNENFNIR